MPLSQAKNTSPLTFLTPAPAWIDTDALAFVGELAAQFGPRRDALLAARAARQAAFDAGALPDFLPETKALRDAAWTVAPIPADLQDRRVEITGPVERKMIINALNSGAKVFMADFEDSLTPTFANLMDGQKNLYDAVRRTITYTSAEGKAYQLNREIATLIVRPRGWHLDETHVLHAGRPIAGALLDFGLYAYLNATEQCARGSGPYFYLPKLETHTEALLWADVFAYTEARLGLARGTIKATVLIEVITATFEMHEILHALKDYCVGLNCGRWDYIFSFIKKLHTRKDCVLPERGQVTMTTHFLRSYSKLLIATCHRRGAFAMGGMSAFIPVKNDAAANDKALAQVRADKEREAGDGHDGTWVAHPALVPVAKAVFDERMPGKNQLSRPVEPAPFTQEDLLRVPEGSITEAGLRNNISVSIQYLASWLSGVGCVPIFNLMEDAATAEIARSQVWQWIHHGATLVDGRLVDLPFVRSVVEQESAALSAAGTLPYAQASELFLALVVPETFCEFLTLPASKALRT